MRRNYHPRTGQFLTVNPALSLTHQPYSHTGNNPLCATDPLGLWSIDEGLDWVAGGLLHGPGANVTSFIVGFGDGASFGLSSAIRKSWLPGSDCTIAKDGFYFSGQVTGVVASTVAGEGLAAGAMSRIGNAGRLFNAGASLGARAAAETGSLGLKAITAGTRENPWAAGSLVRTTKSEKILYRIWGGGTSREGSRLTVNKPELALLARQGLALPESNSATLISEVTVPAGTTVQVGEAASAFGQTGGWAQMQLPERIKTSSFGVREALGG